MRTITAAVTVAVITAAALTVSACSDDQPACAATLPALKPPPGGRSTTTKVTRTTVTTKTQQKSASTNTDRHTWTTPKTSVTYPAPRQPRVTVHVQHKTVNNHVVYVQPRPVLRYDGWRQYPAYGAVWYPPGYYPPNYHVEYHCTLPEDAQEGDWQ